MGLEGVPCHSAGSQRAERDAEAAQTTVYGLWVEIPEQPGKMLAGDPLDKAGRRRLADDQPPLFPCAILDSVQHDGLPRTSRPGVERCSASRAGAVLDGLDKFVD